MYITDLLCISHQQTYSEDFFQKPLIMEPDLQFTASEPSYHDLIPGGILRRMSKIIRMGVGTGMPLLEKHKNIEGIIIGTAHGGVDDSMKFLDQIERFDEGTLTPTNFVQSTPNALSGVLSVMSGCDGYNNTHVHEGLAFENALIDASMFLTENPKTLLVGAADEISQWNLNIDSLKGYYKTAPTHPTQLLNSGTPGTICGEGATMFVMSAFKENALAEICDINHIISEQKEDVRNMVLQLLDRNHLSSSDIDVLISGMNGDIKSDLLYTEMSNFLFPDAGVCIFKHLTGEYPTSSAFAVWMAVHLLNNHPLHSDFFTKRTNRNPNKILIYNHYFGTQHSAILISRI